MDLNICHIEYDSAARVTTFTQGEITLTKIHISDPAQLLWAEEVFKAWQSEVDFRHVSVSKKITGECIRRSFSDMINAFPDVRFDLIPEKADFGNRWITEVLGYMEDGVLAYGDLATEVIASLFSAYSWSGKGKSSVSEIRNLTMPSMKLLSSVDDFNKCYQ